MKPLRRGPPSSQPNPLASVSKVDDEWTDDVVNTVEERHPPYAQVPFAGWFRNSRLETAFVEKTFRNTKYRYLVMNLMFTALLAAVVVQNEGDPLNSNATDYARPRVGGLALCASLSVVNAMIVLAANTTRVTSSRRLRRQVAYIHEVFCILGYLVTAIFLLLFQRSKTKTCNFVVHYDQDFVRNERCPQLHVWYAFSIFIPNIVGQPRFLPVVVVMLFSIILQLMLIRHPEVDLLGSIALHTIHIGLMLFSTCFKLLLEQQNRRQFKIERQLEVNAKAIKDHNRSVAAFMMMLIPTHLHKRLIGSSTTTTKIDTNLTALAVVVQVHQLSRVMSTMLPTAAASKFALFNFMCDRESLSFGLHHLRSVGDTNYLAANLFSEDHVTAGAGAASAVRFLSALARRQTFELQSGIASGCLTGMPLGTVCIRYDVFGPALQEAAALAITCPPGRIHVTPHILDEMGDPVSPSDSKSLSSPPGRELKAAASSDSLTLPPDEGSPVFVEYTAGAGSSSLTIPSGSMNSTGDNNTSHKEMFLSMASTTSFDRIHNIGGLGPQMLHLEEVVDEAALDKARLDIVTSGCCIPIPTFAEKETQKQADGWSKQSFRIVLLFCCSFFALQGFLVVVSALSSEQGALDVPLVMFYVVMGSSVLSFLLLAVGLARTMDIGQVLRGKVDGFDPSASKGEQGDEQHALILRVAIPFYMICCVAMLIGNNLARPLPIGRNNFHLLWPMAFSFIFSGASVSTVLFFQGMVAVGGFYVPALLFRPMVNQMELQLCVGSLVLCNVALLHHRQVLDLYASLLRRHDALKDEQRLSELHTTIQRSFVPESVQKRQDLWHRLRSGLDVDVIDVWSKDQVVLTVQIEQDNDILSRLAAVSPAQLKEYAESVTRLVEDRVADGLRHGTLHVIKVFGGTMTIAGALADSSRNFVDAVEDTFLLLGELRSHQQGHHSKETIQYQSQITVGVAADSVVNTLRVSEFPQFDIMGGAVNVSRALVAACPADGMMVVPERLVELHAREVQSKRSDKETTTVTAPPTEGENSGTIIGATGDNDVEFSDPESWRLRDLGVVRVRRVV